MDEEIVGKTIKTDPLQLKPPNSLDISGDVIFPNEVNQYLKKQLENYQRENDNLKTNLSEAKSKLKESHSKISNLSGKVKEYEILCGRDEFVTSSAVASNKIIELSKKLREKTSEVEVLKTKCSKLEHNLFEIQEGLQETSTKESVPIKEEAKPNELLEDQIKQLQDKLTATKSKFIEAKNLNLQLKNDLRMANKWLQQETGESFETFSSLHNLNTNWRGRAQVICDLQQKNAELKEKIKLLQDKSASAAATTDSGSCVLKSDKKLESLNRENNELRYHWDEYKKKFEGARARFKYLEVECLVLKNKISKLSDESDRHKKEITDLKSQLNVERCHKTDIINQKDCEIQKIAKEVAELKTKLAKKDCIIQNLNKTIKDKEDEITTELLLNKPKPNNPNPRPQSSYGARPKSNDVIIFQNDKSLKRLEADRLRLVELTELQYKRLEEQRKQQDKIESELRFQKQKAAKLEASLARKELEMTPKSGGYSTTSSKSLDVGTLRDQLELAAESIKALQIRLDVEQQERKIDFQHFADILKNYKDMYNANKL